MVCWGFVLHSHACVMCGVCFVAWFSVWSRGSVTLVFSCSVCIRLRMICVSVVWLGLFWSIMFGMWILCLAHMLVSVSDCRMICSVLLSVMFLGFVCVLRLMNGMNFVLRSGWFVSARSM